MDFIIIGLATIAGLGLAGWKKSVFGRIPIGLLVAAVVLSAYVGRHTAILRVEDSFDIMLNGILVGVAAGVLIYRVGHLRRRRGGGHADASEEHGRETESSSP